MTEIAALFAPYGPVWIIGALLLVGAGYFAKQMLTEYRKQNERRSELDLKREERKAREVDERAQRDRERSEMEGRIAEQMARSNMTMEALEKLMESVVTSNEILHEDLVRSQSGSHDMAAKVDHIKDRVDLLYIREGND